MSNQDIPASDSSRDMDDQSESIWMELARSIVPQFEAVPYVPSDAYATLDSIATAELALCNAQAARRAQRELYEAAIQQARQEIWRVCDAHDETTEATLRALREKRNTLIPICRLPPEVLALVFTYLTGFAWDSVNGYPYHIRWIVVTHICRRWREVAIQHAGLWTNINLDIGSNWAATFASRARQVLLAISCQFLDPWKVSFMVDNMWRTQELRVWTRLKEGDFSTLSVDAPRLHTLILTTDLASSVPIGFLGGAPLLRRLNFDSTYHPIPPFCTNLTSLSLTSCYEYAHRFEEDLISLACMRNLQRLSINLEVEEVDGEGLLARNDGQLPQVVLQNLAYLEVTAGPRESAMFLRRLALPCHTVVHCRIEEDLGCMEAFFPVALACTHSHAISSSPRVSAITGLSLATSAKNKVMIIPRRGENMPHEPVTIEWTTYEDEPVRALAPIALAPMALKFLSSAHLQDLTVGADVFDQRAWLDISPLVPGLRRLTVECNAVTALIAALHLAPGPAQRPAILLFPTLAVLEIVDADLGIKGTMADIGEQLVGCLAGRAAAGCCLEELDVTKSDVDAAWVARVREALPGTRVTWNEVARGWASLRGYEA